MKNPVTFALLLSALLVAWAVACEASTPFEIEEFIDGRDGTSTLVILCDQSTQKRVRLDFKRTQLDRINIDRLYDVIEEACFGRR